MKLGIIKNQESYNAQVISRVNEIFEAFKSTYDRKKNKQLFKNKFLSDLRNKFETTERENEFIDIRNGVLEIENNADEGQSYFDSILKYQNESNKKLKNILDYLINYESTVEAHKKILIYELISQSQNNIEESNDVESEINYSKRQQYLAIRYLLESNGIDIDNASKSELTRFWLFLSGKKGNSIKMANTDEYKIVMKPFPKSDKSLENDLQLIRIRFEKLGLKNIVEKINKEINSKE